MISLRINLESKGITAHAAREGAKAKIGAVRNKILLAPGSTFSQPDPFHFRMVLLPELDELTQVVASIAYFMSHY